jgi:hypothetical protein
MDIEKVTKALEIYRKTIEASTKAEQNVQAALGQLKTLAGGSTFSLAEKFFQIRERNGKMYLCELKEKPKGRPKRAPGVVQESETAQVEEAAVAVEATVLDGVEASMD